MIPAAGLTLQQARLLASQLAAEARKASKEAGR